MNSTEHVLTFLMATAVFAYVPGPAMMYTIAQTIARGRSAGWMAALGIHIGGYAHVVAAALGLSVLFTMVPILFSIVKFLGAAYLIWLGVQLFRTAPEYADSELSVKAFKSPARAFWQSITVEVLNPKTAVFYIAFLPQFTDSAGAIPLWAQLAILGTFVNVAFSSADIICVLLSSFIANYFKKSPSAGCVAPRLGGGILIALGINLAVSHEN